MENGEVVDITMTFLVGNLMFTGAQPYEIFQSAMSKFLSGPDDTAAA